MALPNPVKCRHWIHLGLFSADTVSGVAVSWREKYIVVEGSLWHSWFYS